MRGEEGGSKMVRATCFATMRPEGECVHPPRLADLVDQCDIGPHIVAPVGVGWRVVEGPVLGCLRGKGVEGANSIRLALVVNAVKACHHGK